MNDFNVRSISSSQIFRLVYLALLSSTILISFPQLGKAQSLDDWKKAQIAAKQEKGPESIPYASLQSEAFTRQQVMNGLCKVESWSCDNLGTKSIRKTIQDITVKIEANKSQLAGLNSQLASAKTDDEKQSTQNTISKLQQETDKLSELLSKKQQNLENDLKDLDNRISQANQCFSARSAVQDIYKLASDRAWQGESDPEIKVIAAELREYWEKGRQLHQKIFDDTTLGITKCQQCKNGDL